MGLEVKPSLKKYVDDLVAASIAAIPTTIKVGTYTGNDAATQAITGISFQPDALLIGKHHVGNQSGFLKTSAMGVNALQLDINGWYRADLIISLDADGFTVGDGDAIELNMNGVVYSYIAMKSI